ncbi:MAG TPA: helix-turn-helix transcriptional regulator [Actinomycetota bacterium]
MPQHKMPTPKTAKRITDDRDRALYVISVAAELAGVHPQTLRMYERKGLIKPARTEGRARRYSERDIERVRLIQSLTQNEGMNLAGVQVVMELSRTVDQMNDQIARLQEEARRLHQQMAESAKPTSLVPLKDMRLAFGED